MHLAFPSKGNSLCRLFQNTVRFKTSSKALSTVHTETLPAKAVDQSLVSSQVLTSNSPLQSWVAYQRTLSSKPYPSLKSTTNKKILEVGNRIVPQSNKIFHFSCLQNMADLSPWLAFCPYGIEGGAHVDMHGKRYSKSIQTALDAHCIKNGIFAAQDAVTQGSGKTHVWLSWKDIKELQPKYSPNQLTHEPFTVPWA